MSGGAVVNLKGELVGLTTNAANAGGFDAQAGYALPIDTLARRAIEALKQGKEVEYGFLGVQLPRRQLEPDRGRPARDPGRRGGPDARRRDRLDRRPPGGRLRHPGHGRQRLQPRRRRSSSGSVRDGAEIEKTVVLSKLRVYGEVIATNRPTTWRGLRVDFVSTDPKVVNGPDLLQAMAQGGVVVAEVQPGSAAEEAGLKVGQIIVKVEGEPVKNPGRLRQGRRGPQGLRQPHHRGRSDRHGPLIRDRPETRYTAPFPDDQGVDGRDRSRLRVRLPRRAAPWSVGTSPGIGRLARGGPAAGPPEPLPRSE